MDSARNWSPLTINTYECQKSGRKIVRKPWRSLGRMKRSFVVKLLGLFSYHEVHQNICTRPILRFEIFVSREAAEFFLKRQRVRSTTLITDSTNRFNFGHRHDIICVGDCTQNPILNCTHKPSVLLNFIYIRTHVAFTSVCPGISISIY